MSFCGNCGFKVTEGASFCGRCGSSLIEESNENMGLTTDEVSLLNETFLKTQTIKKPFYKSKAFVIIIVAVTVILAATAFFGVKYFSARSLYNKGISQLQELQWTEAKDSFDNARKTGLIFYQDGPEVYKKKLDSYVQEQITKAKSLIEQENYKDADKLLANLPEDSNYSKDIEALNEMKNSKAENKLKDIDKLADEGDYSQALDELQKFKSVYNFGDFQTQAQTRIEDINSKLDQQQKEEEQKNTLAIVTNTASKLISNYDYSWADAVNTNNFSRVEPFMLKGSNLYNSQQSVLKSLVDQGIKEQLLDFKVIECSPTSDSNVYKVSVYEEFNITTKDGQSKKTGFNWVYTMHLSPEPALSDIEKDTKHTGKQ